MMEKEITGKKRKKQYNGKEKLLTDAVNRDGHEYILQFRWNTKF